MTRLCHQEPTWSRDDVVAELELGAPSESIRAWWTLQREEAVSQRSQMNFIMPQNALQGLATVLALPAPMQNDSAGVDANISWLEDSEGVTCARQTMREVMQIIRDHRRG